MTVSGPSCSKVQRPVPFRSPCRGEREPAVGDRFGDRKGPAKRIGQPPFGVEGRGPRESGSGGIGGCCWVGAEIHRGPPARELGGVAEHIRYLVRRPCHPPHRSKIIVGAAQRDLLLVDLGPVPGLPGPMRTTVLRQPDAVNGKPPGEEKIPRRPPGTDLDFSCNANNASRRRGDGHELFRDRERESRRGK